ncbi:DsbC family protein [Mariprofundus sp. EBB-1]|uniref:DsbC family protein n=1 Tax=Mariprofundus sp. EBB-1 TaxID=2650971 RepID=UPI000EF28D71|nr:DsbC family protein [Mariprofundus sp. EBB-1]RLL50993.1 DsbC family protein [Mariprofundus sp. EBB-1]
MRTLLLMITMMLLSTQALAGEATTMDNKTAEQIRKALPMVPIVAIKASPMPGLYELQVGTQILYSDNTGRYLMRGGHILDMQEQKDLTQQRLEDINRVEWSSLPLDKAIVSGDKDSKTSIAIFTDPDCPFCKGLENTLKEVKGVKIYTFLYPLSQLHPDSRKKSEAIWCSKDQHKMLQNVMLDGQLADEKSRQAADTSCKTPIDDIAAIANKLNIHGTPALIAGDGRRMSGAPRTAEALNNWIANK